MYGQEESDGRLGGSEGKKMGVVRGKGTLTPGSARDGIRADSWKIGLSSSMETGGRLDPGQFRGDDIFHPRKRQRIGLQDEDCMERGKRKRIEFCNRLEGGAMRMKYLNKNADSNIKTCL